MNQQVLYRPEAFSVSGDRAATAAKQLVAEIGQGEAGRAIVDGVEREIPAGDTGAPFDLCAHFAAYTWKDPRRQVNYDRSDLVKVTRYRRLPDVSGSLALLRRLPWEVAVGASLFAWLLPESGKGYIGPVVEPGHFPYGWMVAFKGEGHRHLVSRRWLDHCPARVIRDGDITLVQFHDLAADPQTAIEQALPAHEWMDDQPGGGFVRSDLEPLEDTTGLYDAGQRALFMTITGRDLTPREIAQACTRRGFGERRGQEPVDRLTCVFLEEDRARRHLHDLWLREIECRTFISGREVSLTDDYAPPPPATPGWVEASRGIGA